MLGRVALVLILFVAGNAWAEQATAPVDVQGSASPPASTPEKTVVPMAERLLGDHWTVEVRDEITGTVNIQTNVVTEVTPTDITVRFDLVRPDKTHSEGLNIADRSWNAIRSGPWQYFPGDGNTGVQTPLAVGKTWAFQFNAVNNVHGVTWKWSGTSKVVGQETVTTKAGTFDTFRIETTSSSSNFKDSTLTEELIAQTWYAPVIAHWVKRSWILRNNNRLRSNNTYEIAEFGRRQ